MLNCLDLGWNHVDAIFGTNGSVIYEIWKDRQTCEVMLTGHLANVTLRRLSNFALVR